MMAPGEIRLQALGKQFDGRWVVDDVTLSIAPGESVVLIGPSGGGKSVLLKLIAGLLEPDRGTVAVSARNMGMLFQRNALFDSLTVEENLLFPLKERLGVVGEEAAKRTAYFLAAVGLKGSEKLFPDEISGGMQKRLGIARALVVAPDVILYDEPTAGLDPITSRTIAELMRTLRAESRSTVLTVTNEIQRAYQLADRILLMAGGRIIGEGTPEQIRDTRDPAIRQFVHGLRQGPLTSGLA